MYLTIIDNGVKEFRLNGKLHNSKGPAVVNPDGSKEWWFNGKKHNINEPSYYHPKKKDAWFLNSLSIHINGSYKSDYGYEEWWYNGKLHRLNEPAIKKPNGTKIWYLEGKRHNDNGPAVINPNGYYEWLDINGYFKSNKSFKKISNEWWINGKNYTKEEFDEYIQTQRKNISNTLYECNISQINKDISNLIASFII